MAEFDNFPIGQTRVSIFQPQEQNKMSFGQM